MDLPSVSLGYIVAPVHWGEGIATEAAKRVVEQALQTANVWRVAATTDINNEASGRVLKKIGMTREGRLRRYEFRPNMEGDAPRDAYLYARVQ